MRPWLDVLTTIGVLLPLIGYIFDYLNKPREFKEGIKAVVWVLLFMLAVYVAVRIGFSIFLPEDRSS